MVANEFSPSESAASSVEVASNLFANGDNDEWIDWETRHESVPLVKHCIAGKHNQTSTFLLTYNLSCRIMCWDNGTLRHVSPRHHKGKFELASKLFV